MGEFQRKLEFTLATFNCYWFFDDVAPFSKWGVRLPPGGISEKIDRLAQAIISIGPSGADVVALQEVESQELLEKLVVRLTELGSPIRYAFSSDTLDPATGQNVALLSRFQTATRPVSRLDQTVRPYLDHRGFERIGSLGKFLRVDLEIVDQSISIFVLHLKSQREGTEETRLLRNAQTEIVRLLSRPVVEQGNSRSPSFVAILGDMNDVPQSRPIDTLLGKFDMSYKLTSATEKLPVEEQWTYTFQGTRQQLDHILLSRFVYDRMKSSGFTRIDRETSDHDAVWARIDLSMTT